LPNLVTLKIQHGGNRYLEFWKIPISELDEKISSLNLVERCKKGHSEMIT